MKEKRVAETLECILYANAKATGTENYLFSNRQRESIAALVVALHTSFRLTARLYRIFPDIGSPHGGEENAAEDGLSIYRDHAEKHFARLKALLSELEKLLSRTRIMEGEGDESKDEENHNSSRWWEELATYLVAIDYDEVEKNLSELNAWNGEIRAWICKPFGAWSQQYASVRLVSHL